MNLFFVLLKFLCLVWLFFWEIPSGTQDLLSLPSGISCSSSKDDLRVLEIDRFDCVQGKSYIHCTISLGPCISFLNRLVKTQTHTVANYGYQLPSLFYTENHTEDVSQAFGSATSIKNSHLQQI